MKQLELILKYCNGLKRETQKVSDTLLRLFAYNIQP